MLGAIFFELPRDVFFTIIGSKVLQRIFRLSLHHDMEFMKILEYSTFCMEQESLCLSCAPHTCLYADVTNLSDLGNTFGSHLHLAIVSCFVC